MENPVERIRNERTTKHAVRSIRSVRTDPTAKVSFVVRLVSSRPNADDQYLGKVGKARTV